MHVMESSYIAEIIDPESRKPVPRGETGELVLTTLGRLGSPAIRYRTRDLVRAARKIPPAPAAATNWPSEGGILGRADDMVVVRGVNLYPSAVEEVLRADGSVAEFQVEISDAGDLTELRLRIEPKTPEADHAKLSDRITQSLHRSFGLRFNVECAAPGTLPRFEMKAKRWTRT